MGCANQVISDHTGAAVVASEREPRAHRGWTSASTPTTAGPLGTVLFEGQAVHVSERVQMAAIEAPTNHTP